MSPRARSPFAVLRRKARRTGLHIAAVGLVPVCAISAAHASGWVASCGQPSGGGFKYGQMKSLDGDWAQKPSEGFEQITESYSNVYPVFMYAGDGADHVQFVWGDTKPEDVGPRFFRREEARTAVVISASDKRVTTVERYPAAVWVTSHFPRLGIAYATRHKSLDLSDLGNVATATTFHTRCDYSEMR